MSPKLVCASTEKLEILTANNNPEGPCEKNSFSPPTGTQDAAAITALSNRTIWELVTQPLMSQPR